MTAGDSVAANNNQVLPSDATIAVQSDKKGVLTLPVKLVSGGGGSGLQVATGTYTGTGDGTTNPVTFPGKPRMLVIGTAAGTAARDGQFNGSDTVILYQEEGSAVKAFTSALFAAATVDMDLLNTLVTAFSASDINHLAVAYIYWVAY